MNNSATKLGSIMLGKYPDLVEVDENGKFIYKVSVTVDGTWQKRGHTSKVGVVFVIAVLTGEVLEFAISVYRIKITLQLNMIAQLIIPGLLIKWKLKVPRRYF